MSNSARNVKTQVRRKNRRSQPAYVPVTALAKAVEFDLDMMWVRFTDGRELGVPLAWFPVLRLATPAQRTQYDIGGGVISLHWPELNEDLSIAGLMAGVDWRSPLMCPKPAKA
jgi:hypothetical protein